MKKLLIVALLIVGAHCNTNIQPAHADRQLNCKTTCRTDSGGHSICRTVCW